MTLKVKMNTRKTRVLDMLTTKFYAREISYARKLVAPRYSEVSEILF